MKKLLLRSLLFIYLFHSFVHSSYCAFAENHTCLYEYVNTLLYFKITLKTCFEYYLLMDKYMAIFTFVFEDKHFVSFVNIRSGYLVNGT